MFVEKMVGEMFSGMGRLGDVRNAYLAANAMAPSTPTPTPTPSAGLSFQNLNTYYPITKMPPINKNIKRDEGKKSNAKYLARVFPS